MFSSIDLVNTSISFAFEGAKNKIISKPASKVKVMPISGALANCPFDLDSESFFSVGGSVFELLSTSAIVSES
jgi:hypothetical protein